MRMMRPVAVIRLSAALGEILMPLRQGSPLEGDVMVPVCGYYSWKMTR